jgi:hypothetical protein
MQRSLILRGPRWPCNRKMDKAWVPAPLKMTQLLLKDALFLTSRVARLKLTAGQQPSPRASTQGYYSNSLLRNNTFLTENCQLLMLLLIGCRKEERGSMRGWGYCRTLYQMEPK